MNIKNSAENVAVSTKNYSRSECLQN